MIDNGKCVILALLDIGVAFDTVAHELFLNDLKEVGVVVEAMEYLKDCVHERKYCGKNGYWRHETRYGGRCRNKTGF